MQFLAGTLEHWNVSNGFHGDVLASAWKFAIPHLLHYTGLF